MPVLITLLLLVPVGIDAGYDEKGFTAEARISAYRVKLYPRKQVINRKSGTEMKKPPRNGQTEIVKILVRTLRKLKRRICVDNFELEYYAASPDPFDAVRKYSSVNTAVFSLLPYFEDSFRVKKRRIVIATELYSDKSTLRGRLSLSLRAGQLIRMAFSALVERCLLHKKHERKEKHGIKQARRHDAGRDGEYTQSC